MGRRTKIEEQRVVHRIKELLPIYGTNRTAVLVGRHKSTVSNIKHGRRHAQHNPIALDDLELRRSDKRCRRCTNPAVIVTKSLLCVPCTLLEMAKEGVISIAKAGDDPQEAG